MTGSGTRSCRRWAWESGRSGGLYGARCFWCFFLPLVVAVIHIAVAFNVIDKLLAMLGLVNTPLFLACTAATVLVFAVFYVMVFAVTAREYYKIVNE